MYHILSEAPENKRFRLESGEISSIEELHNLLLLKGESFYCNYAEEENHFANWVEHVFKDRRLAHKMRKADYKGTLELLDKHIEYAKLWMEFNHPKEALTNYMARQYIYGTGYEPEHSFETLSNFSLDLPQQEESVQKDDMAEKERLLKQIEVSEKPSMMERLSKFFK